MARQKRHFGDQRDQDSEKQSSRATTEVTLVGQVALREFAAHIPVNLIMV